jgi:hypothetical protein
MSFRNAFFRLGDFNTLLLKCSFSRLLPDWHYFDNIFFSSIICFIASVGIKCSRLPFLGPKPFCLRLLVANILQIKARSWKNKSDTLGVTQLLFRIFELR